MQPRLHDPVAMAMQQHGGRVKSSPQPDDRAAESEPGGEDRSAASDSPAK